MVMVRIMDTRENLGEQKAANHKGSVALLQTRLGSGAAKQRKHYIFTASM